MRDIYGSECRENGQSDSSNGSNSSNGALATVETIRSLTKSQLHLRKNQNVYSKCSPTILMVTGKILINKISSSKVDFYMLSFKKKKCKFL